MGEWVTEDMTVINLPCDINLAVENLTPDQSRTLHREHHNLMHISFSARYINARDFGASGNGTDQTAALQSALDAAAGGTLVIPTGLYLLNFNAQVIRSDGVPTNPAEGAGLWIKSNTRLILSPGTVLRAIAHISVPCSSLIMCREVANIIIEGNGATLDGARDDWAVLNTPTVAGYGVRLWGCTNVHVSNLIIKDCYGDGIIIEHPYWGTVNHPSHIFLDRINIDHARRNGISIVDGNHLKFIDCQFNNTSGNAPGAGIDLEPEQPGSDITDVEFVRCQSNNNAGSGFMAWAGSADIHRVLFDACTANDNGKSAGLAGFSIYSAGSTCTDATLRNCIANRNQAGIILGGDNSRALFCTAEDNTEAGIRVYSRANRMQMAGCQTLNNGNMGLDVLDDCDNISISDLISAGNGAMGIYARGAVNHVTRSVSIRAARALNNGEDGICIAGYSEDCAIQDCTSSGNGTKAANAYANIYVLNSTRIVVANNIGSQGANANAPGSNIREVNCTGYLLNNWCQQGTMNANVIKAGTTEVGTLL